MSIGAYTVAVMMLVAGALGLEEGAMAKGALLALSGGLLTAVPTAGTGLLDWWVMERGTEARRIATLHLLTMVSATLLFAGTWLAQRPGYLDGNVRGLALVLGLIAEAVLTVGGFLGGSIVFVHRHRVLEDGRVADGAELPPSA